MTDLSREWIYWSLVNGIPATLATLAFLVWPRFDRMFAWNVDHRQSGIFLGTGFLMRAALFIHIIQADRWAEISWMVWGNAVFAGVLLGVTMVYGEQFKWRRLIAIIWLFLYIEEPVWMFTLVPEARAAAIAEPLGGVALGTLLQGALWLEAAIMLVVGIYLLRLHTRPNPLWPWKPDRVSQLILAGWPLGWAAWAPTLARSETWLEARGGVIINILWLAAILVSLVVYRRQFDLQERSTRIMAVVVGLLLLLLLAGVLLQG